MNKTRKEISTLQKEKERKTQKGKYQSGSGLLKGKIIKSIRRGADAAGRSAAYSSPGGGCGGGESGSESGGGGEGRGSGGAASPLRGGEPAGVCGPARPLRRRVRGSSVASTIG